MSGDGVKIVNEFGPADILGNASEGEKAIMDALSINWEKTKEIVGVVTDEECPLIPTALLDRIEAALDRHVTGSPPRRTPIDLTDSDLVLDDLRRIRAGKVPRDWLRVGRETWSAPCARCGAMSSSGAMVICGSHECPNRKGG